MQIAVKQYHTPESMNIEVQILDPSILSRLLTKGFLAVTQDYSIRFISEGKLRNEGAASAIRDGIGCGFKRLAECREIPGCLCPYCRIFKPAPPPGSAGGISPGFVIETYKLPKSPKPGDTADVKVTLIGSASDSLVWFTAALLYCGELGIGRPNARFTVTVKGNPKVHEMSNILSEAASLSEVKECSIRFRSPCIIEDRGLRRNDIDFPRLIKAIVERIQPSVGFWCENMIRNKDRDAIAADTIADASLLTSSFSLSRVVHERTKDFKGTEDSISGFIGRLNVSGNLGQFWPLLLVGEILHVGLRPHLDRGRYTIEPYVVEELVY